MERGRTGGSRLSHAGRSATVGQILRQLDTRFDAAECVAPSGNCPLINECLHDAELQLWLEHPEPGAKEGFMSLREVDLPADASLYLCGSLPFMKNIRNTAISAGIAPTRIHYEVFGPDIWLAS